MFKTRASVFLQVGRYSKRSKIEERPSLIRSHLDWYGEEKQTTIHEGSELLLVGDQVRSACISDVIMDHSLRVQRKFTFKDTVIAIEFRRFLFADSRHLVCMTDDLQVCSDGLLEMLYAACNNGKVYLATCFITDVS